MKIEDAIRVIALELIEPAIEETFGPNRGFALFVADFGETGSVTYISNINREDMITTIKQWLDAQR